MCVHRRFSKIGSHLLKWRVFTQRVTYTTVLYDIFLEVVIFCRLQYLYMYTITSESVTIIINIQIDSSE